MDKGRFQCELVNRLGHVEIVHVTFNFSGKEMIPGPFENSEILDYDILFIDRQEDKYVIQIQVKFQDPEHPFVTIEVRGKMIGFDTMQKKTLQALFGGIEFLIVKKKNSQP